MGEGGGEGKGESRDGDLRFLFGIFFFSLRDADRSFPRVLSRSFSLLSVKRRLGTMMGFRGISYAPSVTRRTQFVCDGLARLPRSSAFSCIREMRLDV